MAHLGAFAITLIDGANAIKEKVELIEYGLEKRNVMGDEEALCEAKKCAASIKGRIDAFLSSFNDGVAALDFKQSFISDDGFEVKFKGYWSAPYHVSAVGLASMLAHFTATLDYCHTWAGKVTALLEHHGADHRFCKPGEDSSECMYDMVSYGADCTQKICQEQFMKAVQSYCTCKVKHKAKEGIKKVATVHPYWLKKSAEWCKKAWKNDRY